MRFIKWMLATTMAAPLAAAAERIINTVPISSVSPLAPQPQRQPFAQDWRTKPPSLPTESMQGDVAQFDRYQNESNDAYIVRMKIINQHSVADMERKSQENAEKMEALAPK